MSSLQERIKKNSKSLVRGPSGVLQEETPDIQELSGTAGLPVQPIDPMSAGALGANPDQQKMMGSPANVKSAQNIALSQQDNLQSAERTKQARTQATQQEAAAQQKSKDLQELGGLGDRVQNFIQAQRQKLQQVAPTAQVQEVAPQATLSGLPTEPDKLAALKNAAKALQQNPQDMNALLEINKALGRNPNTVVSPEEIQELYATATDTIAKSGSDAVDNTLQVDDLIAQGDFGYDLNTLSDLLGVPPDQLKDMSVGQLRSQIQAVSQAEMSQAQQLQQQAGSINLGAAERSLARDLGREASAVGVRASEQDFKNLDDSIANADIVSFGGKEYKVDELLQDDTISQIITDYLNSGEDSEIRKELERTEPELLSFIKKNQAVLDDAARAYQASASQFSTIQKKNQELSKVAGTEIDQDLMKQLLPGYGELSATELSPSAVAFFQRLDQLPTEQKAQFVNQANTLASNPLTEDIIPELASLAPQQLADLQLERGANSVKLQQLLKNRQTVQQLQNIDPNDIRSVISYYSGGQYNSPEQLQKIIDSNKSAAFFGFKNADTVALDADKDGKLDDPKDLYNRMLSATKKASLTDTLNNAVNTYEANLPGAVAPAAPYQEVLLNKLGPLVADGDLSESDIKKAKLTPAELSDIIKNINKIKMPETDAEITYKDKLFQAASAASRKAADKITDSIQDRWSDYKAYEYTSKPEDWDGRVLEDVKRKNSIDKDLRTLQDTIKRYKASGQPPLLDVNAVKDQIDELTTIRSKLVDGIKSMQAGKQGEAATKQKQVENVSKFNSLAERNSAEALDAIQKGNRPIDNYVVFVRDGKRYILPKELANQARAVSAKGGVEYRELSKKESDKYLNSLKPSGPKLFYEPS